MMIKIIIMMMKAQEICLNLSGRDISLNHSTLNKKHKKKVTYVKCMYTYI